MVIRRFLFQGDSITDGGRGRTADPNHVLGHSYAFSLGSRLAADFPELELEFFNRGCGGDSHIEMEKRWQADTLDLNPDVLSILIGINGARQACGIYMPWDTEHPDGPNPLQAPEAFESALRRMLDAARQNNPKLMLVLCTPFRYFSERFSAEDNAAISEMVLRREAIILKLVKDYGAILADFHAALDKAIARNNNPTYWCWDGVHVTAAGSEILAREWMRAVSPQISFLQSYRYTIYGEEA